MAEVNYQSLLSKGAYQVTGYVTYGSRIPTSSGPGASEKDIRGYIDASGKFQFNPYWSVSGTIRAAPDRTFLRRYDIRRHHRLRSTNSGGRVGYKHFLPPVGQTRKKRR